MPLTVLPGGEVLANNADLAARLAELPSERIREILAALPARPAGTQEFAERYRHFRLPTPWFHRLWYDAYDDPTRDHIYVPGPREHAKTTTVLTYGLRRLAADHHVRIGIISGADDLAMKFLGEIKHELETNERLIADYGGPFVGDHWTDHELVLKDAREGPRGIAGKDVSVFSVGRGGQISSRHCDVLIVDDVESAKSVKSDLMREATRQWWSREVAPVLSPHGKLIVVGTRKHFDDLYAHLIGGDLGTDTGGEVLWHVIDVAKEVYRPDGTPIWPEMWSAEALARRKAQLDSTDVMAWAQEYLNSPRPSEDQMFFPDAWPTYEQAPWGLSLFQYWDLAISERAAADFTVGVTIGVDAANSVYLLELRRGHWDFNRTLGEIAAMGQAWSGPNASGSLVTIGIEDVAYQAAAVQEAIRRTLLPIVPDKVAGADRDKVARARLVEARARAGKVLRPARADWWSAFATEATFFPFGAHDDQIDALAGAIKLAGWQADTIGWAYGVWTCQHCSHMFMWAPRRACPKCGRPAPETWDNPELTSMGALGAGMEDRR